MRESQLAVPVIEAPRLHLRAHTAKDLEASITLWSGEAVYRYTTKAPGSRSECWSRLLRYRGHWAWMGFGYWAVEEKASGEFVGELDFGEFMRDITPSIEGSLEAGWFLLPHYQGRGYTVVIGIVGSPCGRKLPVEC